MTRLALALGLVLLVPIAGCRTRAVVRTETVPVQTTTAGGGATVVQYSGAPQASATVTADAQLLYLPVEAAQLPLHLIQAVVIQTSDGRSFQLTAADVQQAMAGRLAVRMPAGVTTGTATIYLTNGQTWSTTFHIAVSSSSIVVGGGGPVGDARCQLPAGTWQGTISDEPGSRSTVWLEVLGDCRSVRGYIRLITSGGGSVDSTIEGYWDLSTYTIVARDTQLFNVQPEPGGSFCATDEYQLQLSGDGGTIQGANIVRDPACAGVSRVWLQRSR